MQQIIGNVPHAVTPSPAAATGHAHGSTAAPNPREITQATAELRLVVTHDQVTIVAALTMGRETSVLQRWQRRKGHGRGWVVVEGVECLDDAGAAISQEFADWLGRMPFPHGVANMLPRPRSAAAVAAIAAAAQEVTHG